jgi:hypothetical protein
LAELEVLAKKEVTLFFSVLDDRIVQKNNVDAPRIFNMNETALSTVQKPQNVLAYRVNTKLGQ